MISSKSVRNIALRSFTRGETPTQCRLCLSRLFLSTFLTIHSSSRMITRIPGEYSTISLASLDLGVFIVRNHLDNVSDITFKRLAYFFQYFHADILAL